MTEELPRFSQFQVAPLRRICPFNNMPVQKFIDCPRNGQKPSIALRNALKQ